MKRIAILLLLALASCGEPAPAHQPCPKCGAVLTSTDYVKAESILFMDVIRKHCYSCDYDWDTEPLE